MIEVRRHGRLVAQLEFVELDVARRELEEVPACLSEGLLALLP